MHWRACRGPRYNVAHVNFGSPRVGNAAFVRDFNRRVPDSWRLHSDTDVITYVPRGLDYAHVGVGVKFAGGGKLIVGLFGERRCDVDASGICADAQVRPFDWPSSIHSHIPQLYSHPFPRMLATLLEDAPKG
jgi:hypothetical protein